MPLQLPVMGVKVVCFSFRVNLFLKSKFPPDKVVCLCYSISPSVSFVSARNQSFPSRHLLFTFKVLLWVQSSETLAPWRVILKLS